MLPSCFFSLAPYCLLQIFIYSFLPLQVLRFAFHPYFCFECSCLCSLSFFSYLDFSLLLRMICWWNIFLYLCPGSIRLLCGPPFVIPGPVPLLLVFGRGEIIDSKLYWSSCVPILFCCTCSQLWFPFSFSSHDYFSLLAIGPATNSVVISVVLCACELHLHFIIFSHILILCSLFPFILPLLWLLLLA